MLHILAKAQKLFPSLPSLTTEPEERGSLSKCHPERGAQGHYSKPAHEKL